MGSQCRGKDEPGNQGTAMLRQAGGGGGEGILGAGGGHKRWSEKAGKE